MHLNDYTGLGFFNGILICHYTNNRKEILNKLKESKEYKIEILTDNEVLYNNNNEWVKL